MFLSFSFTHTQTDTGCTEGGQKSRARPAVAAPCPSFFVERKRENENKKNIFGPVGN